MKFAIIAFGFSGSTLPLAHYLSKEVSKVDCYYLSMINSDSIESLDFDCNIKYSSKPIIIKKTNAIYNYINTSVNIKIIPLYKRKRKLEKIIIGRFINVANKLICRKIAKEIAKQNYDVINIIIHSEIDLYLCKLLYKYKQKIIITYHEVLVDLVKGEKIKNVVKESLKLNTEIILHSEKTKNDLITYSSTNITNKINIINFGPFESYTSYKQNKNPINEKDYILFFGSLHQYKGLNILYEAIKCDEDLKDLKFVIAGNGNNEIVNVLKQDNRFIVINRYIRNEELVSLIKDCKFVICPYIAASQSGVVQTALGLGKYILATNIGAFSEIIVEGKNGFLCEPNNPQNLAEKIRYVINNHKLLTPPLIPNKYNWSNIISEYLKIIKK